MPITSFSDSEEGANGKVHRATTTQCVSIIHDAFIHKYDNSL